MPIHIANVNILAVTWTLPAAFSPSVPAVKAVLPTATANYTGVAQPDLGATLIAAGLSAAVINQWRGSGAAGSWASGAQVINVATMAVGRWF